MTYSKDDTYKYSVIEVSERIHGSVCGTADTLATDALQEQISWLEWRTTTAWAPSLSAHSHYDTAVWNLAYEAIREGTKELRRRSTGNEE